MSVTPPSSDPPPSSALLRDGEDHDRVRDDIEEEAAAAAAVARQPLLPEDGYQWKKYGQKPIKTINMIRSYYKCRSKHCKAKKRAEWLPSDPSNLQIIYSEGAAGNHHNHAPPPSSHHPHGLPHHHQETVDNTLQYELGNQVFGRQRAIPSTKPND